MADIYKPILAKRVPDGVIVWYECDDKKVLYTPDTVGFNKWAALADEQRLGRVGDGYGAKVG